MTSELTLGSTSSKNVEIIIYKRKSDIMSLLGHDDVNLFRYDDAIVNFYLQ